MPMKTPKKYPANKALIDPPGKLIKTLKKTKRE